MGLVYRVIQKKIGQIHLTSICWLIGLSLLHANLYGQAWPTIPNELQFAGVPIHLTAQSRQMIQQEILHLYASPKAIQTEVEAVRQLTPQLTPLLQKAALPDDFILLAIPFADTDSLGYWALSATQAQKINLRVDAQVDERYHSLISTKAVVTMLSDLQKKNRNYAATLVRYLEWTMQVRSQQPVNLMYVQPDLQSPPILWKILARKFVLMYQPVTNRPTTDSIIYPYLIGRGKTLQEIAQQLNVQVDQLKVYNQWLKADVVPTDKDYAVLIELSPDEVPRVEALVESERNTQLPLTTGFPVLVKAEKSTDPLRASAEYYQINGRRGVQAQNYDNIITLAFYGGISINAFLKFNDITDPKVPIQPGQVYYLQRKARRASVPFHVVQPNQTLLDISNQYGVRLKSLLKFNRIPTVRRLPAGQILSLQSKRPAKQPLDYGQQPQREQTPTPVQTIPPSSAPTSTSALQDFVWTPALLETVPAPVTLVTTDNLLRPSTNNPPVSKPPDKTTLAKKTNPPGDILFLNKPRQLTWHVVKSGQTPYSISQLYGVTVRQLYLWNHLSERTPLRVGQSLLIQIEKPRATFRFPTPASRLQRHIPTTQSDRKRPLRKATFYTVQAGQTLYRIAVINRVRVKDLVVWNKLKSINIEIGQVLVIWR